MILDGGSLEMVSSSTIAVVDPVSSPAAPILHASSGSGTFRDDPTIPDHTGEQPDGLLRLLNDVDPEPATSLPWILQVLFGINGVTLSLLILPLMYIINTHVRMPVALLSTYGAISFLPYSFKPIYAYMTTCQSIRIPLYCWGHREEIQTHSTRYVKINIPPRHILFVVFSIINGICIILHTLIPSGGIAAIFIVAFCRAAADSWAELCLGLTLIDNARALEERYTTNTRSTRNNDEIVNNIDDNVEFSHNAVTSCSHRMYDKIVSKFQAQAATSRNNGSLIGSFVTFLVFLHRYLTTESNDNDPTDAHQQLSGRVANALIIGTGIVELIGAGIAILYQNDLKVETESSRTSTMSDATRAASFALLQQESEEATEIVSEMDNLRDDENSTPSYSSLDDSLVDNDSLSTTGSNILSPSARSGSSPRIDWVAVVLLQLLIISIPMRGPLTAWTSHFAWEVLVISLGLAFFTVCLALYCNGTCRISHRAGLFLILRNAVPSEAMVASSFFYSIFQTRPLMLEFFALLGMGIRTVSSWSYTKLWSRFCRGRPFLFLIAGLVILAGLASLLNIRVYHQYRKVSQSDDGANIIPDIFGISLVAQIASTFFDEWAFLPQVVLASVSLLSSAEDQNPYQRTDSTNNVSAAVPHNEVLSQGTTSPVLNNNVGAADVVTRECCQSYDKRVAVEYGSLISCIDFGDQLGSLAAAPLVAVLGISRENDFLHLDVLILICSISKVVVTILLLPLIKTKR